MSEPICILYICRHGETVLNASGKFRGNANPPLNNSGIRDAHYLAAFFKDQPLSFIISSDKTRAVQTADIIADDRNIKVHQTPTLRALNVGDFSGKPRDKENTDALQVYLDNPDEVIPGGESLNAFKSRIRPALWDAFKLADDAGEPGLIVAHSSIVHECGSWIYQDHKSVLVEPGGVLAVFIKDGKLGAEAVYKPVKISPDDEKHANTIS